MKKKKSVSKSPLAQELQKKKKSRSRASVKTSVKSKVRARSVKNTKNRRRRSSVQQAGAVRDGSHRDSLDAVRPQKFNLIITTFRRWLRKVN